MTKQQAMTAAKRHGAGRDSLGRPCTLGDPRELYPGMEWRVPVIAPGNWGVVAVIIVDPETEEAKLRAYV